MDVSDARRNSMFCKLDAIKDVAKKQNPQDLQHPASNQGGSENLRAMGEKVPSQMVRYPLSTGSEMEG